MLARSARRYAEWKDQLMFDAALLAGPGEALPLNVLRAVRVRLGRRRFPGVPCVTDRPRGGP